MPRRQRLIGCAIQTIMQELNTIIPRVLEQFIVTKPLDRHVLYLVSVTPKLVYTLLEISAQQ